MAKNQTTKRIEQRLEGYRNELVKAEAEAQAKLALQAHLMGKIDALEDILSGESPED